jgi:hypothetical protein
MNPHSLRKRTPNIIPDPGRFVKKNSGNFFYGEKDSGNKERGIKRE